MNNVVRALGAVVFGVVFSFSGNTAAAQTALPIKAIAGETIQLDPTDAIDLPSQSLTPSWRWVARPALSVAEFSATDILRPNVTLDLPGTYRAEVDFIDATGTVAATAVVDFGSENLAPVARARLRGLPGGANLLTVDGAASFDVDGDALTYQWEVASAPTGATATFAAPQAALSGVSFDQAGEYTLALTVQDAVGNPSQASTVEVTVTGGGDALDLQNSLSTFNLITQGYFGNQEVEGRTYIGKTIESVTGQFGYAPAQDGLDYAEMYIKGDLKNSTINLTPGDVLSISGTQSYATVNNGTLLENQTDLPAFDFDGFKDTSAFLASLTGAPADVSDQNNKRFGGAPNAVASEAIFGPRTRVVETHMNDLKTGGYSIDLTGTDTVIINVAGKFGDFQMNPLGGTGFAGRVIWNFFEATSIKVNTPIVGHVLAPYAWMNGFAGSSEGTVIAHNVQLSNGELHQQPWLGVVPAPNGSQSAGGVQVGPVADLRFDQLAADVGAPVVLDPFASSDVDGDVLTPAAFVAVQPAGAAPVLSTDADGVTTFTADAPGAYLVALNVSDASRTDQDQVLIVVGPDVSARPVAQIADVTAAPLEIALTLDGSQSYNLDGALISHEWTLLSAPLGSTATLTQTRTGFAELTPDVAGDYIVQLEVADADATGVPATKLIRVKDVLPLANAGPDLVAGDAGAVTLDGSLSTGFAALDYAWSGIGLNGDGGAVALNDAGLVAPDAVLDQRTGRFRDVISQASVYHLKRSQKDGLCQFDTRLPGDLSGTSANQQIKIKLTSRGKRTENGPTFLVWEIDNKRTHTRQVLLRDANGVEHGSYTLPGKVSLHVTTPDIGNTKLYAVVDGTNRANAKRKNKTFNRNNPVCTGVGSGVVQLIVSDGSVPSLPDSVFVGNGNIRPVLTAGPGFETAAGAAVDLNAALYGTDANGDTISYTWSLITRPDGSTATLDAPLVDGPALSFTPDRTGTYLLQVTATDGAMIAVPAVIAVTVMNSAPVASATGPAEIFVGGAATLDGSASFDPDGDALTFNWVLTTAPVGSSAAIPDPFGAIATFTPDLRGAYAFSLVVSDGQLQSDPVSVIFDAPNRAPVAALELAGDPQIGAAVTLNALASSDPDGDALTFDFAVTEAPSGSTAAVVIASNGEATLTPDLDGIYAVQVTVSDGVATDTATVGFEVQSNNQPPALAQIQPEYSVEVGLTLEVQLEAIDPEGQDIGYFVQPLPLPAGMELDAATGTLTYAPAAGSEGTTYTLTLGATDGVLTTAQDVSITVLPADGGDTAISGRVLDANDFAQGVETPIPNVAVRIGGLMTTTDALGAFSIGGLSEGTDILRVEPDNATLPQAYSSESRVVDVIANQVRPLNTAVLLSPLSDACAPVVAGVNTFLDGGTSGVTISIPADSVTDLAGAPYRGQICLGSLPQQLAHAGFSDGVEACQIYALDAPGAIFTQEIAITAPNVDALPVGARATLWQLQQGFARFSPINKGDVSSDGTALISSSVNLRDGSSLFAFLPQAPRIAASADQPTGKRSLSMFEGNLNEAFDLVDYQGFSRTQSLVLSYNSATADPNLIVSGDVRITPDAGLPLQVESVVSVGGLSYSDTPAWNPRLGQDGTTPALVGEEVSLRQSAQLDASGLSNGQYGYTFTAKARYACSTTVGIFSANTFVHSETASAYGAGWAIDGLQTLVPQADGSVTILDDDTVTSFTPAPGFAEFDEQAVVIPAEYPISLTINDFDGDGLRDVAVAEGGPGDVTVIRNFDDRNFDILRSINVAGVRRPDGGSDPEDKLDLTSLVSLDFNLDGLPDIPWVSQIDENLGVLIGDGTANFQNQVLSSAPERRYLTVADLDGDGYEDIVYGGTTGFFVQRPEFRTFFGGPDGFEDTSIANPTEGGIQRWVTPIQLVTADIDGDGNLDVAMRTERGIHFAFGEGGRNFTQVTTTLANDGYFLLGEKMQVSDANGDGLLDVFTVLKSGFVYYPNVDGRSWGDPVSLALPPGTINGGQFFLRDTNGDGLDDIVHSSVELTVYEALGDGTFGPAISSTIDHPIDGPFAIRDMDGDGTLDLVSLQAGANGSVTIDFSTANDDGALIATNGEFSELTALPGGGWERRYKDGLVVVFDANGLQIAETDPRGNTRAFAYDVQGRLTSVTDQNGEVMSMAYNAAGYAQSITYPDGRVTELAQTTEGALESATYPDGSQMRYRYDEEGRMIAVTDERGNTTEHSYTQAGSYAGTLYPDGSSIANQAASTLGISDLGAPQPLAYVAPEDRITVHTDEKGNTSLVELNSFGAIIRTEDALGRVTIFTRNEHNLVTALERPTDADPDLQEAALPQSWFISSAHAQGQVASFGEFRRRDVMTYDDRGNMLSMRLAVNSTLSKARSWTYEPEFSRVTQFTDFDGVITTYEYNSFGELIRLTDPEFNVMTYDYNVLGLKSAMTDARGNVTRYSHNARNNVSEIELPDLSIVQNTYDNFGNVSEQVEAAGLPEQRTILRTYDSRDRLLDEETLDVTGASIDGKMFYEYDAAGNLTAVEDETGLRTVYTYDEKNQQVAISVPGYGTSTYGYNEAGELIQETNAEGHTQTWAFDVIGRITFMQDAVGNTARYTYDARDNVIEVVDGRENLTAFTYDIFDRVRTRTNPIAQTIAMNYDERDNLIRIAREDGSVETATYDGLSRRLEVVTPDNTLTYAYDRSNNVTEAADNDSRLTMTYDSRDRLASVTTDGAAGTQPQITLSYTYNARNERQTVSDSLGGTWTYGFDERSRVQNLTAPWGDAHAMEYDPAGRQTVLSNGAGRQTVAAFTEDRLAQLEHFQNAVAIARSGYDYAADGQIAVDENLTAPALSRSYAYDQINRLTNVAEGVPTADGGTPIPVEDYAYDEAGNPTMTHQSSSYVVDDHNRMLETDAYAYGYDEKGNRTSRTDKVTGGVQTYAYDSMNQMISVSEDGVEIASYAYDALGRRIAKTVGGVTDAYVYDIGNMYDITGHDRLLDFTDGTLTKRWLHGQNIDEPVAFESYGADTTPGAGAVYALHGDRQGSIIAVTDQATGSVAARYTYDAFGQREETLANVVQDRGFTGREFDAETGLYYYRARHYDPALGRFLQSDPLGFAAGDLNLYAYTWNDPQNWTDPSGLAATADKATLTARVAGLAGRLVGTGAREAARGYAEGTVANGVACLSNKVGTYLMALGQIRAEGGDFTEITSWVAGCVVEAVAPVRCRCQGAGRGGIAGALGGLLGGIFSFPEGTEVLTPSGRVAIETLREGDLVIGRNEETGVSGAFPVTALMSRTSAEVLWLTLEDAAGTQSRLGTTSEHPMFVAGQGWITAGELVAGDALRDVSLQPLQVLAVEVDTHPQRVHNLEVADAHTFFAGEVDAWGHNARRQVSRWFSSRKKAKDAACGKSKPIPPGLSRKKLKDLVRSKKPDGPDKYGRDSHFHDDDHNNGCKPNIHYRYGGRK